MTDSGAGAARLEIRTVIDRTVQAIKHDLGPFLILAALFAGAPTLAFELLADLTRLTGNDITGFSALGNIVAAVIGSVAQVGILLGAKAGFEGGRLSLAEMMQAGVGRIGSYFGVTFFYGLCVFLAALLFLVPGVLLAVAWAVGPAVLVFENKGMSEAFRRSSTLTKGNRWRVLALLLLFVVGYMVVGMGVIIGLTLALSPLGNGAIFGASIGVAISVSLGQLLGAAGGAALYHELRRIKDGDVPSEMASIFE